MLKIFPITIILFYLFLRTNALSLNPTNDIDIFQEKYLFAKEQLSEKCDYAMTKILQNGSVLQYIDASAHLPTGLFRLNLFHLGDFDSCYGIKDEFDKEIIYGKYCLTTMSIEQLLAILPTSPDLSIGLGNDPGSVGLHFGTCVPHVCTAKDVELLQWFNLTVQEEYCQSVATAPEYTGWSIFTFTFFGIIFLLVLASTVYDLVLQYTNSEAQNNLWLAFSVLTNGKKLITSTNNPEQLLCLNGIKAISMAWVILGHNYSILVLGAPISNAQDITELTSSKDMMWLIAAPLSVDSFFTVGGLVTMYTFLKTCDKKISFNIPLYYIHRYLRLTPALLAIILINAHLVSYWGNGPLWRQVDITCGTCREYWWSAVLYIQNIISNSSCVPQSWYLSADMQIFVFSPLVLYPMKKWPKVGLSILGIFIVAGILVPFGISYSESLPALTATKDVSNMDKYTSLYYSQPYARFGPYVIGMAFGYLIYKIKKNEIVFPKNSTNILRSLCLWLFAITGLVSCLYSGAAFIGKDYDRVGESIYNGLNRPAWGFFVCIVILLCVTGFGGPVDAFLSMPLFQFVTKLSYSMYLVHYTFITARWAAYRIPINVTNFFIMHIFWGDFIYSLGLSAILSLCFESPIITLEKFIFGGCGKKKMSKPSA